MNGWGGRRPNQTGRPKGTVKPEGRRKLRFICAYDGMRERFSLTVSWQALQCIPGKGLCTS